MKDPRFVQLDVTHSGRVTHKIIGEMRQAKWLDPHRQDELKESLHAMALSRDWTLEGRAVGQMTEILYSPDRKVASLVESSAGLTLWEIKPM